MDDFSLGDLIWDVAYVDHLRGLLVLRVQLHLETKNGKSVKSNPSTHKAESCLPEKNDYEDEAAAFHFAPKGLRLFFFEPARLDGRRQPICVYHFLMMRAGLAFSNVNKEAAELAVKNCSCHSQTSLITSMLRDYPLPGKKRFSLVSSTH